MMARARLVPVRLTEIPFSTRLAAARRECAEAENDQERRDLIFAAMFPSDTLYFVVDGRERLQAAA